jgi:hypothetical protein
MSGKTTNKSRIITARKEDRRKYRTSVENDQRKEPRRASKKEINKTTNKFSKNLAQIIEEKLGIQGVLIEESEEQNPKLLKIKPKVK